MYAILRTKIAYAQRPPLPTGTSLRVQAMYLFSLIMRLYLHEVRNVNEINPNIFHARRSDSDPYSREEITDQHPINDTDRSGSGFLYHTSFLD